MHDLPDAADAMRSESAARGSAAISHIFGAISGFSTFLRGTSRPCDKTFAKRHVIVKWKKTGNEIISILLMTSSLFYFLCSMSLYIFNFLWVFS